MGGGIISLVMDNIDCRMLNQSELAQIWSMRWWLISVVEIHTMCLLMFFKKFSILYWNMGDRQRVVSGRLTTFEKLRFDLSKSETNSPVQQSSELICAPYSLYDNHYLGELGISTCRRYMSLSP